MTCGPTNLDISRFQIADTEMKSEIVNGIEARLAHHLLRLHFRVAFGDLENDGSIGIVMNCNGGPAVVLGNRVDQKHWLMVNTIGIRSNRDGIGAQIHVVTAGGLDQYQVISTASTYLSDSDKRAHFGLGAERFLKYLEITWPSGIVQRIENVKAD